MRCLLAPLIIEQIA